MIADNPSLKSLSGLGSLTSAGAVRIMINPALGDLSGLERLTHVGGLADSGLLVWSNSSLVSASGLSSLTSIDGFLNFLHLKPLMSCAARPFVGKYSFITPRNPAALRELAPLGAAELAGALAQALGSLHPPPAPHHERSYREFRHFLSFVPFLPRGGRHASSLPR